MKARRQEKRTPWRETVRVIAVVFLLLATVDLAFPQLCGEDNGLLFPRQTAGSGPADDANLPGNPLPPADDCFCCCSHILSADFVSPLGAPVFLSDSEHNARPHLPLAPVQYLFHPPRLG